MELQNIAVNQERLLFKVGNQILSHTHNPSKAKKLLSEAGYPNGLKLRGESVTAQGDWANIVQFVSDDLKKIGVDLEFTAITLPELIARVRRS